jgi:flagellum-specific peptidoglycan hydrolase FlgJ
MYNDFQNKPFDLREHYYQNAPLESKEGQNKDDAAQNRPRNTLNDTVFRQHYYEAFGDQRPAPIVAQKSQQAWAFVRKNWAIGVLMLGVLAWYKDWIPNFSNKKLGKTTTEATANKTKSSSSDANTPLSIFGALGSSNKSDLSDLDEATKVSYLRRFAQVAINERQKSGIPSSVILAMAVLQSRAGTNDYATRSNNHFALPCTIDWSGGSDQYGDKCLRKYENAWVSFRNFNVTLTSGKFSSLHKYGSKDYKGWAKGLDSLGYPSNVPNLSVALIDLIEKYQLTVLDTK